MFFEIVFSEFQNVSAHKKFVKRFFFLKKNIKKKQMFLLIGIKNFSSPKPTKTYKVYKNLQSLQTYKNLQKHTTTYKNHKNLQKYKKT